MAYTAVMHYAKYLLILVGLAFASASHAQIHIYKCDGCTDAEYERKAITLDSGIHYLYDFNGNEIRLYRVQRVRVGTPESTVSTSNFELQAIRQPVSEKIQKTFDARRELWLLVRETTAIVPLAEVEQKMMLDPGDPDVPERLGDVGALDVVMIEALQNTLEEYVRSELLEIATMPDGTPASATSTVSAMDLDTDVKHLVITVEMSTGGEVAIRYTPDADSFAYVEDSARDAAGNRIPEPGQADQVPGTYAFDTAEQFQSLGEYLSILMPNVSWPEAFCSEVRCVSPGRNPVTAGDGLDDARPSIGIACACKAGSR